jgi:hypothetical protein
VVFCLNHGDGNVPWSTAYEAVCVADCTVLQSRIEFVVRFALRLKGSYMWLRIVTRIKLLALIAGVSIPCLPQTRPDLYTYLKKHIGLDEKQIQAVHGREGFAKALPEYFPDFYNYLLSYPRGKPANAEDKFYWAKVKFGLKPTLRMVHVVTMRWNVGSGPAYVIAEKQLYASHYFRTALDLTFCISDLSGSNRPGFHLIKMLASEQAGLTGFKGSIVRKLALDRSASSLQKSLAAIKADLEQSFGRPVFRRTFHHTPLPVHWQSICEYTNLRRELGRIIDQAAANICFVFGRSIEGFGPLG